MADLNYIQITDINQLPDNAPESNIYYMSIVEPGFKDRQYCYMYYQDLSKLGTKAKGAWVYIGMSGYNPVTPGTLNATNMTGYIFGDTINDFPKSLSPEFVQPTDCSQIFDCLENAKQYVDGHNIYVSTKDGNKYVPTDGQWRPFILEFDDFVKTLPSGSKDEVTKTSLDK